MDIVIISEFCEDFSKTDNDRFLYLAKMLSGDNNVEIITSSFRHTTKKHRRKPLTEWPFKITFVEEPGYPKNVCLKRFQSHHKWGKNVENYLKSRKKPDVVYCAVPSLTGPNLVAKFCEKNNIRFVIDVQDLWPEAFQMIINIPVISSIAFLPFKYVANSIYKRADAVCGVSDTYVDRALAVNKKCNNGTSVYLGTDLGLFDCYTSETHPFAYNKSTSEIWIGYCGTLGSSYDITVVIDALATIDDFRIKFLVMGDGPKIDEFKADASNKDVNALFLGRLPYDEMCKMLYACDIAVNPITHGAAQSIINKHADYVGAGLPIINTQESEEFRRLIDDFEMGINCENGNSKEVAQAIQKLIQDTGLRKKMGLNARKCAEQCFDRKTTYRKLTSIILDKD